MLNIEDRFVSIPSVAYGGRSIVSRRGARLIASGGKFDVERGLIKGGDPECTAYPDGARPLFPDEIKIVRKRFALD